MRKIVLTVLMAMTLALAACGGAASGGTSTGTGAAQTVTVKMDAANYDKTAVTIKVGGSVVFTDNKDAGVQHNLAFGENGIYAQSTKGPTELNNAAGLVLQAGDSKTVTFANAGTYRVTCIIHPAMNLTVTVQG